MVRESPGQTCRVSYVLQLSDDTAWNLRASTGARSWLQEFARILSLPAGFQEGIPSITFVRGAVGSNWFGQPAGPPDTHNLSEVLADGWHARHLVVMRLWSRSHGGDHVCELLNTSKRSR